jgi:hypothetical protein
MAVLVGLPRRAPATVGASAGGVATVVRGPVSALDADRALAPIVTLLVRAGADGGARIRLTATDGPDGPAVVQVNLRCGGAPARIQVDGADVATAILAAADRVQRQLRRLTVAYEPWPWPDAQRRLLGLPGPGRIVRRKPYRLLVGVPCQAAAFMNAMDYDVMLYTDAETGEDAVVYRSGPTGLRLARQRSMHPPTLPVLLPMTVNSHRVPTFTETDAANHLAQGWLPYVFYTDRTSGRGNLVYRRYDGELGLISPA